MSHTDALMDYLLKRTGRYYYNRRVPETYQEFDPRRVIRIALKTECRKQAARLAVMENDRMEAYWRKLAGSGQKHGQTAYQDAVTRAETLGFSYASTRELATAPLEQLIQRILHLEKNKLNGAQVEAVLGAVPVPIIKLDDALQKYFAINKDKLLNKSPNQIRKWEHPRKRSVRNFIDLLGNKPVTDITRNDLLQFRDWWIGRIKNEDLVTNSANKDLIHLKTIIETASENLMLNIDIERLFKKLLLKEEDERRRLPFETEYIISTLLNPENLNGLNKQAFYALHAIAETGAGPSEQVGLMPDDIVLDVDIPHIVIQARSKKILKTKYRKRIIPLVGYALEAFKACPQGFTEYKDAPDLLSNTLNKYLNENGLLPTKRHTVYSLRHSFQDRLLAVNAPDRVQADLMGHKFNRQSYGQGSTLAHKLEWMRQIQLII